MFLLDQIHMSHVFIFDFSINVQILMQISVHGVIGKLIALTYRVTVKLLMETFFGSLIG